MRFSPVQLRTNEAYILYVLNSFFVRVTFVLGWLRYGRACQYEIFHRIAGSYYVRVVSLCWYGTLYSATVFKLRLLLIRIYQRRNIIMIYCCDACTGICDDYLTSICKYKFYIQILIISGVLYCKVKTKFYFLRICVKFKTI